MEGHSTGSGILSAPRQFPSHQSMSNQRFLGLTGFDTSLNRERNWTFRFSINGYYK
jgi:hypothetical protein